VTADIREERRVITALFADLVGSTSLGERLEPEEVKLVVGEAVARIVGVIEDLGGHVKDLAGDGVLAFFGAPVAAEDDAERAARSALRIVTEVAEYGAEVSRAWGVEGLAVRVGLATGPVVLGLVGAGARTEYAAFGDTINTAARLQSAAHPGSILADADTRRLIAPLFEWGESRELELQGKSEPVPVAQLAAVKADGRAQRGVEGMDAAHVGREREFADGREALGALLTGAGGILFVTGEPGIGKSRFLLELRREFESGRSLGGAPLWIEGRCVSYGESLPYWPFRELLHALLGVGREAPELRVRLGLRRVLERLFGARQDELYPYLASLLGLALEREPATRLGGLSPEALQYRTFEVVESFLERLAEEGPLAVAIEDLHWADPTSVQLVERLLGLPERAPVLIIVSQRNEPDHSSWALRERAAREYPHLTRELALQPLNGDAQAELLASLVGSDTFPETLSARLLDQAEGNPFYLEELIRSLVDTGALLRSDGRWTFAHEAPIELPSTVEKVILARLDRLSAGCRDVVTAASALGRRFPLALLEGIVGTEARVQEALHELQRLDLVRPTRRWPQPEYRFKHALIQEAAYRTLLTSRRMELHRRAAEWVEDRYPSDERDALGLLAYHWLAARDEDKAAEYLVRAGDRARAEHALDEAIDHYRALLPLLERRGEHQQMALVLFKLALALHTTLRFGEANAIYAQAFELWEQPPACEHPTAVLRVAADVIGRELDPAKSYAPADMQLQMAVSDRLVERWPEAAIVPSLAERWEIADDGLHYVFRLRPGLRWSDGTPLTAADVEYGVMRTLSPEQPGVSVSVYFVLDGAQDYALGRGEAANVGVHALDERTVEFRLAAPAPYFMSVVNRPDAGPQPRHAIEAHGAAWTDPERHVVSGAFVQVRRSADEVVLERRQDAPPRAGNVGRVHLSQQPLREALELRKRGEVELVTVQPTTPSAAHVRDVAGDVDLGPSAWTVYLVFDHRDPLLAQVDFRLALASALDRDSLDLGPNFLPGTGGIVPPALLGHTPEIAPRFDPERARDHLSRAKGGAELEVAATTGDEVGRIMHAVVDGWREVLGIPVRIRVLDEAFAVVRMRLLEFAPAGVSAWFPGYPDPEYYLRLLLHSEAADNRGRWQHQPFDELIERARHESDGRRRSRLFHAAERMAIAEQAAVIPIAYARNAFLTDRSLHGWWEFGKSWASYADLRLDLGASEDVP
jgi:ABC-type transport system substrate-binding protein/class 3 adenylate cyclase